jgi:hypothetical protein
MIMTEITEPYLEAPCKENEWKWRVYGIGMVWDHAQEWQARWKLHYLQVSRGTTTDNGPRRDTGLPQ